MLDLKSTLKQHEIGWIGDGVSYKRDVPFFYKDLESPNPKFLVDVITASPRHNDWYFRIYRDNVLLRKDLHFVSAEAAYQAARLIVTEEQIGELSLRRIERWEGDQAYAVDGHTDTVISEVEPGRWWIFRDRECNQRQHSGPWTSLEGAFLVDKFHFCKVN